MGHKYRWLSNLPILLLMMVGWGCNEPANKEENLASLSEVAENYFTVGAAISQYQLQNSASASLELVQQQYNSITPENLLKWENVHPQPDSFNFEPADQYINFGKENEIFIVGHTLVWHSQTPDWVYEDEQGQKLSRSALLDRMENHISTVAGRYQDDIDGWDVVNEVFNEDGSFRESKWYKIIGDDFIRQAFKYADEAAPNSELYYNDYNLWKPEKRDATVKLVKDLQANDIRIDGVGMQSHVGLEHPSLNQIEESILAFSDLGVDVMISEIDINVSSYVVENELEIGDELPDSLQQKLATRYADLAGLFKKHCDKISRLTFWGVNDGQSWLNYWEDHEIDNHPLLFDRQNKPKPAFYSVIETLRN